ncbi:putative leucine-rich repeat receptor-like protein kinase [Planoprotostelium fungivorum]|uniref:Putative leucine-rich repeat receptor-like protein kinase n=1 Tax=Planoprotostelium fungivorum TaxID=1890364 RepID=A0A2P6NVH2_9EUKA|nr:putative leucine-rich repeat receptor-like protein kinase [Planoprotostelium fungivorum]
MISQIEGVPGFHKVFRHLTSWPTYGITTGQKVTEPLPSLGFNSLVEMRLVNLTTLDLSSNSLSGAIPSSIQNLIFLTGTIPTSIGQLVNIQSLYLDSNQLSGSIPDTIGSLISLHWLDLSDNLLTGSIPPSIGGLFSLTGLSLHDNQLNGPLPGEEQVNGGRIAE